MAAMVLGVGSATQAAGPNDIVLYASDVATVQGNWSKVASDSSPGSVKLASVDAGWSTTNVPLASPADYVEATFSAQASTDYHLWLRLRATSDSKWNDSVWVQFSDARVNGASVYPINTASGLLVNLATSADATSLSGWGWQNGAYWLAQPATVTFAASGSHTMRIQIREDGVEVDQIVLSAGPYLSSPPGPPTSDTTIVRKP
jgi:hypothetical protein